MYGNYQAYVQEKLGGIEQAGLFKRERVIEGPQQAEVMAGGAGSVELHRDDLLCRGPPPCRAVQPGN